MDADRGVGSLQVFVKECHSLAPSVLGLIRGIVLSRRVCERVANSRINIDLILDSWSVKLRSELSDGSYRYRCILVAEYAQYRPLLVFLKLEISA